MAYGLKASSRHPLNATVHTNRMPVADKTLHAGVRCVMCCDFVSDKQAWYVLLLQ